MENKKSHVVIMGCESYDNELVYEKLKAAVDLLGQVHVVGHQAVFALDTTIKGDDHELGRFLTRNSIR